ncbi:MAG TPA: hypothetical protein PLX16_06415 [Exilispira sp.]|nr:hypothetical protein [Exilispira sp.]
MLLENSSKTELSPEIKGIAVSLFVSENIVYVSGAKYEPTTPAACYWVNGVKKDLPCSGLSGAFSIVVSGEDVYIAGNGSNGLTPFACYWKNDVKVDLPCNNNGMANSIFVVRQ